eukprot:PhF_6_TR20702/c0_g1_i1/m.29777/K07512/MECR, NRBF1; mitochondrial trans-2-enoyl-CoA reductase
MKTAGYRFSKFGAISSALRLQDWNVADPLSGTVTVKLLASPIHRADIGVVNGTLSGLRSSLPAVAGLEGVGVIEKVGNGVSLKPGTRVWINDFTAGTWCSHINLNPNGVTPIGDDIPVELASMSAVWYTANKLLTQTKLNSGDHVLVSGGSSALAAAVSALGAERKLNVTLACDNEQSLSIAKARTNAVPYTVKGAKALRESLKGSSGVRLFISGLGGPLFNEFMKSVGDGGQVSVVGAQKGYGLMWATSKHFYNDVTLSGFYLPKLLNGTTADQRSQVLSPVYDLIKKKKLVYPTKEFTLNNALNGFETVTASQRGTKAIIRQN